MTVPCNLAASMMYRETARRPARFYALRAASGADGSRPIPTLLPEKGFSSSKSPAGIRRDGQRPKGGQRGQTCGTLPRPRKQPTGLICAPLRRGRAVRVLPSFATKTEKSRRDTAGRAAPQRRATGANLRDSPAPSQTAHRADLRPAAAGTGCSSPPILRHQNRKVPPGYGGTFVLVEDGGLEPSTSAM